MSGHRHLSRELLLAARRGQISERRMVEILVERFAGECPRCREEAEAAQAEEVPEEAYRPPVRRALDLEEALRRYDEDARSAAELLALLEGLSPEQRLLRIRNSPERFGNVALGEELGEKARACLPHDPRGSLAWARALEAVAGAYPTPYPPHRALALAFQGNAYRAAGDFQRGRALLLRAQELVVQEQVADVDVRAELHSFLGSLFTDLRRLEEAAAELRAAAELFELLADDVRLARILMKLGLLHALMGDLQAALQADHRAVHLLSPERDTQLYLSARLNLALHLADAGEVQQARETLDLDFTLFYDDADDHTRVRFDCLQARLAAESGEHDRAERRYRRVLGEFARQGHGFNAAHVCLELAALYADQGRLEEVAEMASQAVEIFRAHETHRDALGALLLLRDAALERTLTARRIRCAARDLWQLSPAAPGRRSGRHELR
ncbi:MAG: hypothetical protein ACLF0P_13980 [Thermoanaerobaculia bacterium]